MNFSPLCMDSSFTLRRDQWLILTPRLPRISRNIHCQTARNPVESNLKILSETVQSRGWCWRWWVGRNICKLVFQAAFWVLLLSKNVMKDSVNVHHACEWAACQDAGKGRLYISHPRVLVWRCSKGKAPRSVLLSPYPAPAFAQPVHQSWAWHLEITYHRHVSSYSCMSKGGYFWSQEGFSHLLCDIPGTSQEKAEVLAREYPTSWRNQMARSHICGTEKITERYITVALGLRALLNLETAAMSLWL